MSAIGERPVIDTVLDNYAHTRDLKNGALASPRISFNYIDVKPMNRAFRPMVEGAYDLSEMAIATFLQARAARKPLVLLPVVMMNRFHHASIVVRNDSPLVHPRQLNGKRVGVRAYSQTTGLWVRGILSDDYGVENDSITWVTDEAGHVSEARDPANVEVLPDGSPGLVDLLMNGEIEAWIGGREAAKVQGVRPLIPDAAAAETAWFERTKVLPINHMVALRASVAEANAWIVNELMRLFEEGKALGYQHLREEGPTTNEERFQLQLLDRGIDPLPMGMEAVRTSLECATRYAAEQHLIPDHPALEELFDMRLLEIGT